MAPPPDSVGEKAEIEMSGVQVSATASADGGKEASSNKAEAEFTTVDLGDSGDKDDKPEKKKSGTAVRVEVKQPVASTSRAGAAPAARADKPPPLDLMFRLDESVTCRLAPAEDMYTWKADDPVKIDVASSGPASSEPVTIPACFRRTVTTIPHAVALAVKRDNQWIRWTFKNYYIDSVRAAKAFIKLGLEPYHGVGILGFNSPEWLISAMGCVYAGGLITGIYLTNTPDAVHHVMLDSHSNVAIVDTDAQLQKMLAIRDRLPELKAIVMWSGKPREKYDNVYTWEQFMKLGEDVPDQAVQQRLENIAPNRCCSLIYTSGTTGAPKGVMLSHDNYTWLSTAMNAHVLKVEFGRTIQISYLPLSHTAAQFFDFVATIIVGGSVFFAQPDVMKGTLVNTLKEVRPTLFGGVPRVWEKMMEGMINQGKQSGGLKKKITTWAHGVGVQAMRNREQGRNPPAMYKVANALVFKKVKALLGLDRANLFVTGAAPTSKEVMDFFGGFDIVIRNSWGMSELAGPSTMVPMNPYSPTNIGIEVPGLEMKDMPNGEGEICVRGRARCMGYLDQAEKTVELIDSEGWLHSGDVGTRKGKGPISISGRIKELLITAGGENVAPVPIEETVKAELPCISQCMLIGDRRKYLCMLLTLRVVVNTDTLEPTDKLAPMSLDWCRSVGSKATTVTGILDNKDIAVLRGIQRGIEAANNKAISRAQKIQKWSLLPEDFSVPGGELGPTFKMKRPVVDKKYEKTIECFYQE